MTPKEIDWFLQNPEMLVVFIRGERRASKSHGKKNPARKAWKDARKSARTLVRVSNDAEDLEAERLDTGAEEVPQEQVAEVLETAREIAREHLEVALAVDAELLARNGWWRRFMARWGRQRRIDRLILAGALTPWQEHARIARVF